MHNKASSPDQVIEQILAKPATPWQPPVAEQMLRYRVRSNMSTDAKEVIAHALGDNTPHLMQAALVGPITVFQAARAARIELSAQVGATHGAIFVRDPGQGMLLLDTATRRFLHCDESQMVQRQFRQEGQTAVRIEGETPGEWAGRQVRVITFVVDGPIRLRVRIAFLNDPALDAFREEAVHLILGCEPAKADSCAFTPYGFPVWGETFYALEGATQGERRVSNFELEELSPMPYDPALFSVPPGYQDMRGASASAQQPQSVEIGSEHKTSRKPASDSLLKIRNMSAVPAAGVSAAVPVNTCRCLPGTYGAIVAASVEQEFLNHLRVIANQITKRLTGFAARVGKLKIPWLAQFKDFSDNRTDIAEVVVIF